MPDDPTELAERLLALSEKATEAPWRADGNEIWREGDSYDGDNPHRWLADMACGCAECRANAAFIAAARNAIEPLCRAVIDGPRWRDKPTAGIWLCATPEDSDEPLSVWSFTAEDAAHAATTVTDAKWFGPIPIPEDTHAE